MCGQLEKIFVDTNIIIEAHRTGCWKSLVGSYDIHIVEKVREEALRGRRDGANYIRVEADELESNVTIHSVGDEQLAAAIAKYHDLALLDDGEKHLLAYAFACEEKPFILTTADKAAVKASCGLGLGDLLKSLEELGRIGSCVLPLKNVYTKAGLDTTKTEFILDNFDES